MARATYFSRITEDDLRALTVVPPYEPRSGSLSQWVRGAIKIGNTYNDFVVTGPMMRVCYGQCRYNKLVMTEDDTAIDAFRGFLDLLKAVEDVVCSTIWSLPERYKPNAKTNTRFLFDPTVCMTDAIGHMREEIRCRLSSHRLNTLTAEELEDGQQFITQVDTDFFVIENGQQRQIAPEDIQHGWKVIPILKFSYYRNVERFGLVLTVLRAHVIPTDEKTAIPNKAWAMDYGGEFMPTTCDQ
jgi:hypothetical protein